MFVDYDIIIPERQHKKRTQTVHSKKNLQNFIHVLNTKLGVVELDCMFCSKILFQFFLCLNSHVMILLLITLLKKIK